MPISNHFSFPRLSILWQLLIHFLSLWICLFWTHHINGNIQYLAFCVWILSPIILFLRFIYAVAWIGASFFFMANNIPFYLSVYRPLGCLHFFLYCEQCYFERLCTRFFQFSLVQFCFCFGCTAWHAGPQFPDQGSNPGHLQWKHGALTTGPPGKKSLWTSFCVDVSFPFSWVYTQAWSYGSLTFLELSKLSNCFLKWLFHFPIPSTRYEGFNFSTSSPTFVIICSFHFSYDSG